jgi:gamma-glutamyltranspeptidase / glutathione hydrolase
MSRTGRRLLVLMTSLLTLPVGETLAQRAPTMAGRSPVYAPNGVAATSQPLATTAAISVLQHGGNAIDAAVTAAAVLSVVEPMMTGIGGDMFALIWSAKEKRLVALNASGRAGALMTRAELVKRGRTHVERGIESVTVPGALAGWDALLKKYGTITLAQAVAPAIGYAENGYPVTPVISGDWAGQERVLERDEGARATFLPNGHPPKAGEWFRNPDYAATLRDVAENGMSTLYGGALGQKLVARIQQLGGFVTLEDLKKNQPTWVTPISTMYKGYRVWELPPNNQGIAALEMLRVLEPYDLKGMGQNSAAYLHHLIEAKKLAYADLAQYVGDADHLTISPSRMLSDEFINERRSHLDSKHAAQNPVAPGPERTSSETIYLTVADKDGNMVSFINSLFDEFGSGIVVPGTGFALQDRGSGFTMKEGLPNTVAPGKRPFHTLIPAFVTKPGPTSAADGTGDTPYMSFGLMGGAMQAQGHAQFLINMLVFGMNVQEAMDAGRFRHEQGTHVIVESAIPDSVIEQLRAMGHDMAIGRPSSFGGSQAIIRLSKGYVAGSDPRKDGHAAGY